MNTTLKHWLAVAPSFLAVAAIAVRAELLSARAVEVRLEVAPFDPMDPLAGRYLATPLAISRLDVSELRNACPQAQSGDSVWVELESATPFWRPTALHGAPPPDAVVLRGVVRRQWENSWTVDYELERFFIPASGADPSALNNVSRPQLTALVRVDSGGAALLVDLLVDGEPYALWNARQPRPAAGER